MEVVENKYFKWIFIPGNSNGITHALHDKVKNEWFFVHATMYRFPAKVINGSVVGIITLCI